MDLQHYSPVLKLLAQDGVCSCCRASANEQFLLRHPAGHVRVMGHDCMKQQLNLTNDDLAKVPEYKGLELLNPDKYGDQYYYDCVDPACVRLAAQCNVLLPHQRSFYEKMRGRTKSHQSPAQKAFLHGLNMHLAFFFRVAGVTGPPCPAAGAKTDASGMHHRTYPVWVPGAQAHVFKCTCNSWTRTSLEQWDTAGHFKQHFKSEIAARAASSSQSHSQSWDYDEDYPYEGEYDEGGYAADEGGEYDEEGGYHSNYELAQKAARYFHMEHLAAMQGQRQQQAASSASSSSAVTTGSSAFEQAQPAAAPALPQQQEQEEEAPQQTHKQQTHKKQKGGKGGKGGAAGKKGDGSKGRGGGKGRAAKGGKKPPSSSSSASAGHKRQHEEDAAAGASEGGSAAAAASTKRRARR